MESVKKYNKNIKNNVIWQKKQVVLSNNIFKIIIH